MSATKPTTAEIWLGKINSTLSSPIVPGSREDEIAYDAYVSGKSVRQAIAEISDHRAALLAAAISRATAESDAMLAARAPK